MESIPSVGRRKKANGNVAAAIAATPDFDLHGLLDALNAMQAGNFSVRLPGSQTGVAGKICDAFNTIVAANQRIAQQLEHVGEVVGRQGKTRTRVRFGLSDGAWADMEGSVNALIDDLLWYPGLPIILATGYAELPADPALLGLLKLAKPCSQGDIAASIHNALSIRASKESFAEPRAAR
jgi:hypothetical protein